MSRKNCDCKKHRNCDNCTPEECKRFKKILKNFAPSYYILEKRVLPDGTVLTAPTTFGSAFYTADGHRGVQVVSLNPDSTVLGISVQSTYSITDTTYSETLDALQLQNNVPPTDPTLYLYQGAVSGTAPVTCENGNLVITNFPVDPVNKGIFYKNRHVAYLKDGSVDHWKRIC